MKRFFYLVLIITVLSSTAHAEQLDSSYLNDCFETKHDQYMFQECFKNGGVESSKSWLKSGLSIQDAIFNHKSDKREGEYLTAYSSPGCWCFVSKDNNSLGLTVMKYYPKNKYTYIDETFKFAFTGRNFADKETKVFNTVEEIERLCIEYEAKCKAENKKRIDDYNDYITKNYPKIALGQSCSAATDNELLSRQSSLDIGTTSGHAYPYSSPIEYVSPYLKKDGTMVDGHYKTRKDSTKSNNWSTKGNTNPFTGKKGYVKP